MIYYIITDDLTLLALDHHPQHINKETTNLTSTITEAMTKRSKPIIFPSANHLLILLQHIRELIKVKQKALKRTQRIIERQTQKVYKNYPNH